MKQTMVLILSLALGFAAHAEGDGHHDGNHPCKEIKAACESAGFTKGGHKEKKGLFVDCMKKVMNGESVEGVSVDAGKVAACKEKKEHMKEHKKESKSKK